MVGVIVGVGIDAVGVARFAQALARTASLAARFVGKAAVGFVGKAAVGKAAVGEKAMGKKAVVTALGVPAGLRWHGDGIAAAIVAAIVAAQR
ncbi:hypothetical protein ACN27F_22175 [Solwaraspora sp. WMMB335]|uniref:hypothetical protein n=1 Tax=Solwaraspora sp. WMMB335 TaxID=3404118 RepID=UPI003B95217C